MRGDEQEMYVQRLERMDPKQTNQVWFVHSHEGWAQRESTQTMQGLNDSRNEANKKPIVQSLFLLHPTPLAN